MPACTITRTHRHGRKLDQRDWEDPIAGQVQMASIHRQDLNRVVQYLHVPGAQSSDPDLLPALWEPHWLTFGGQGMMVVGLEEIDSARYYQGWYVRWV